MTESTPGRSGQGLKQLPDGRWRVRVEGPRDTATGKRLQVSSTLPTKRSAQKWRAETLTAMQRGTYTPPSASTFGTLADAWLAQKSVSVRAVTHRGYEVALKPAREAFGSVPVQRLTPEHVRRLVRGLSATHAQRTVSLTLFAVRGVLSQAAEDGMVRTNVAARVKAAGQESKRRAELPAEHADMIAAHAEGDRLEGAWMLTLNGLRRSEVMAVRWSDLDTDGGWLEVTQGRVQMSAEQTELSKPKSHRSVRPVPLAPSVLAAFKRMRAIRAAECLRLGVPWSDDAFIAVAPDLRPLRPEAYSDAWLALCDAASVPRVTLHGARHGSVTRQLNAGVPIHIVAAYHGHDPAVALRTYAHADRDALRNASWALFGDASGGA